MKSIFGFKNWQDHDGFVEAVNNEMDEMRKVCADEAVAHYDSKVEIDRRKKKFDTIFEEATQNKITVKYSADFMTAFFTKNTEEMYNLFNYMVCHYENGIADDAVERAKEDAEENAASDIAEAKADAWRSQHGD